jgi:GT2 family glycosyltransferase
MKKVDILLPIYNSYEETNECIKSILNFTNKDNYNLYLLDDCSTDKRIQEMAISIRDTYSNIIYIRNKENLGFPENVNNGIRNSENDVIIINSDTIVTENWVEKLNEVAYSEVEIGAVNPMTNYGYISCIPTINHEINNMFEYKEIVDAFNRCNFSGYVETPFLIGFCIFIKRSTIEKVGYLNSKLFKRGYGEETDWCMRARKKGVKLVIAKAVYVHHVGGTSFGSEKEELRKEAKRKLLNLYPEIDIDFNNYIKLNLLKNERRRIIKELDFFNKSTNIKLKLKMMKHYLKNKI